MAINYLVLSYPNFTLGQIIDPDEANQNNSDIANKVNEFVDEVEQALATTASADAKADSAILTADGAVLIANTKGDEAIGIANGAVSTANGAVVIATDLGNEAVGIANQATLTATNAEGVAIGVQTDYTTVKPQLDQAVIDVNNAIGEIGTIIDGTVFDKVGAVYEVGEIVALEDGVTTFTISNTLFNPSYDYLELTYRGVELEKDINYTRAEGSRNVVLLFSLLTNERVAFKISKNALIDPTLSDGTLLMDLSVGKSKLELGVQEDLDKIAILTDDVDAVTLATTSVQNEVTSHKAETAKMIKVKQNITLTQATWTDETATSGYWEYSITDTDITVDSVVDVNVQLASLANATMLVPITESKANELVIYANSEPSEDIMIDYKIIKELAVV